MTCECLPPSRGRERRGVYHHSSGSNVLSCFTPLRQSNTRQSLATRSVPNKFTKVVRVVIDTAQHQTFGQSAEEQVLVRVRSSTRGNGIDLAVDGPHRILDRALLEGPDVRHLHGRIQGGLLCEQGGVDDLYLVIGIGPTGHEYKRRRAAHQSYLDIDAVDQEFILQKQVHVQTAYRVDDLAADDVRLSSHESCISCGPVGDIDGIRASDRVLVSQLTLPVRDLRIFSM